MANTVIGFFDDNEDAQQAITQLQQYGIPDSNIDFSSGASGTSSYTSTENDLSETNDRDKSGNAVTRFFNSLFGDDSDDARKYSRVGENSKYIVTVHATSSDEAEEVADILDDCGAIDVDERAASYSQDSYRQTASSELDTDMDTDRSSDSINRIEEELQVGKREVETGRVRLRSRIVETPVEEHVRLRQERIDIERTPVDRRVSSDENRSFQEQDIELTERAEIPVVNKEARVVEEIRLNKEVEETDETIRDTVRKTEVDIDEDRNRTNQDRNYRADGL
jgi:stress response protein YsnF